MIVYYTSCSALNNPMAQFYVDSTFASIGGCATDSAAAGGSSRSTRMVAKGEDRPRLQTNSSRHM